MKPCLNNIFKRKKKSNSTCIQYWKGPDKATLKQGWVIPLLPAMTNQWFISHSYVQNVQWEDYVICVCVTSVMEHAKNH